MMDGHVFVFLVMTVAAPKPPSAWDYYRRFPRPGIVMPTG